MDLTHPIRTLIPSLAGPVLEVLAGASGPLSGREIAGLVGDDGSPSGVALVLGDLVRSGLVDRSTVGRTYLHTLNRDHLLAPLVAEAATGHRTLLDFLSGAVRSLDPPPLRAILFGSTARREAGPDSDIDLALVFERRSDVSETGVSELAASIDRRTGNRADIVTFSEGEFAALGETAPALAAAIEADGRDLLARAPA